MAKKAPTKGPANVKVTVKKKAAAPTKAPKVQPAQPGVLETLIRLARSLATLQRDQDELEAKAKAMDPKIDTIMDEIVYRMDDIQIKNFTVEGLGQVQQYPWFSPKVLNKETLLDWFRSHPVGKLLLREDIPHQTMKSFFKELMDKGEKLPPEDVVDVLSFSKQKVKIVKGRG